MSQKAGFSEMVSLPDDVKKDPEGKGFKEFLLLVCFIILTLLLGNFFTDDVLFMAERIQGFQKYSFLFIGIAIAIPQLIISVVGLLKGKEEVVLGMVMGSAMWDMIVSVSIQAMINPIYHLSELVVFFFLIVSVIGIGMALIYIRTKWKLRIWEAVLLMGSYVLIFVLVLLIY